MRGRDAQGSRNRPVRWWAALLLALGSLSVPGPAMATRGKIPVLIQVTRITQGDVWKPTINRQHADTGVFTSDGDVVGPSPGHREVYLYEVATGAATPIGLRGPACGSITLSMSRTARWSGVGAVPSSVRGK